MPIDLAVQARAVAMLLVVDCRSHPVVRRAIVRSTCVVICDKWKVISLVRELEVVVVRTVELG